MWKSRYLPLYGYVAEDMSFAWIQGLRTFLPWPQRENVFDGFEPRATKWTDEFARFKASKRDDVRWDIEPAGIQLTEELIRLCHDRDIRLILVYSPEYSEMQAMTKNRKDIFEMFGEISSRQQVPLWDYSNWRYAANTAYFTNSQHLNADGAELFSGDVAMDLKRYIQERNSRTLTAKTILTTVTRSGATKVSITR